MKRIPIEDRPPRKSASDNFYLAMIWARVLIALGIGIIGYAIYQIVNFVIAE